MINGSSQFIILLQIRFRSVWYFILIDIVQSCNAQYVMTDRQRWVGHAVQLKNKHSAASQDVRKFKISRFIVWRCGTSFGDCDNSIIIIITASNYNLS